MFEVRLEVRAGYLKRRILNTQTIPRRITMKPDKKLWALIISLPLILAACASQRSDIAPALLQTPPYVIQTGDQLDIKFIYNPDLNETVTVRPDGKISLRLVDEIQAAGQTPAQLKDSLTEKYAKELRNPEITVMVKTFSLQRVYVGGEVNRQGFVDLAPGMSPLQAVIQAGGLTSLANARSVLLIRKGPGNEPVQVRVDLKSALNGSGTQSGIQLQPQDVVYVPKSFF